MPKVRLTLSALAFLIPILFVFNFAGAQRTGTDTYAITNARIVTVSGPAIDRGTIVIRDGLIAAVGPNVTAPADARVIDGAGLTAYPGLIDSNTSLGIAQPTPSVSPSPAVGSGGGGFGQGRPLTFLSALNSSQPPGLQPELLAEDFIRPGGDQIDAARNVGITTALTAPRTGIWMGQSALINLAGDTTQQMIVRSPVAMHVGFTPLRGTYPNSLMGVFASLRQMLLDAQRYREAHQIYERSPRGMRRPDQDRSLAALLPVLDGTIPVVMYADREREISRALDLAQEFTLRAIIAGGLEADKLSSRLRDSKVPVLLSLNFPRRTTTSSPEADPEPIRILRERAQAPKVAGRLAAARVRFAFQSGSLSTMTDFHTNLSHAIENGLSRDEALRALTLWPAEILNVADRLGSIETGKIANLTITRGDLFDRNPRIAYVFIDGRQVDLRAATTPAAPAVPTVSVNGTWSLNVDLGTGEIPVMLALQQEGERLRGSIQGGFGSSEIANASVGPGGEFRFTVPATFEGQTSEATFIGRITGNQMQGTVNVVGRAPGSFSGTKGGQPIPAASPVPSPTPN